MKEDKLIRLRQEITQADYRDYRPRRIFVTIDKVDKIRIDKGEKMVKFAGN